MNVDPAILKIIRTLAGQYHVEKIVLFGSRARGDHHSRSDIDLAVWGIHDAVRYLDFQESLEEQIPTLLRFDIVDMDSFCVSDALREEIRKDGVLIYEKI